MFTKILLTCSCLDGVYVEYFVSSFPQLAEIRSYSFSMIGSINVLKQQHQSESTVVVRLEAKVTSTCKKQSKTLSHEKRPLPRPGEVERLCMTSRYTQTQITESGLARTLLAKERRVVEGVQFRPTLNNSSKVPKPC